jgi:high-affinity nickel-transport protein
MGLLFGLGFDTATEVALLFLAAGAAGAGLPFYAILCLPLLFAAGMALLDTLDGSFMNFAYGWAFSTPVRKVFYNMTITGLSVFVALFVGLVEIVQILTMVLHLQGGAWDLANAIDFNVMGFVIVGAFILTWVVAFAVFKLRRIDERWGALVEAA